MLKKILLASVALFGAVGTADAASFVTGWNFVTPTNCVFLPGTPATPAVTTTTPPTQATPATPDSVIIVVDIGEPAPVIPHVPPPKLPEGEFTTSDPVAISIAVPFCKDGTPFFAFWDGTQMLYFSMYPNIGK